MNLCVSFTYKYRIEKMFSTFLGTDENDNCKAYKLTISISYAQADLEVAFEDCR